MLGLTRYESRLKFIKKVWIRSVLSGFRLVENKMFGSMFKVVIMVT